MQIPPETGSGLAFCLKKSKTQDLTPGGTSELKFNDQNALLALYGPLSEGLHGKSDEECLEAASHIRTLLDALGERLEQVIDQEESILNALKGLQDFSAGNEADE